jgi:hypothetical protein
MAVEGDHAGTMRISGNAIEAQGILERFTALTERDDWTADEVLGLLEPTVDDICERGSFDEDSYLKAAHQIVGLVASQAWDMEVAAGVLALSRLHCGVRSAVEEHSLFDLLSAYAAEHPNDVTDYNDTLVSDLVYHHYYWEAQRARDDAGLAGVLAYLKSQSYLDTPSGVFHRRTILRDLIHTRVAPGDTESLERIAKAFGDDDVVAGMVQKRR